MTSRGAGRRDSASILGMKSCPKLVFPPGAICCTDGCIEWGGGDLIVWGVDVGEGVAQGPLLVDGYRYASTLGTVGSGGFVWWIFLRLRGRASLRDIGTRW